PTASPPTRSATPSPPTPANWGSHSKTCRTPWATPTRVPPAATTAGGTPCTATRPCAWASCTPGPEPRIARRVRHNHHPATTAPQRRTMSADTTRPATPAQALRALIEGNQRFVTGRRLLPHQDADYRTALARAQRPFAAVFGCSDSRLPAEIIFDQGLGDLFVIRTAGHVAGTEVLGSIESAVAVLDTPLVAVLGHASCGAVAAALAAVRQGTAPDGLIREVVERVTLSALAVRQQALADPGAALADHIGYPTERVADGRCGVVGLSYRLAEGSIRRIAAHGL